MRHLFSIPLGQEIAPKSIPKNSISLGAAAIIAGGTALAAGLNSWASNQANKANASMDAATRNWQSEENEKNRQWQEQMWNAQNLYNTPSAQRDRLREAGFNPWISGSGGMSNVAQSAGTPASASTPQHTPQRALPLGDFASGLTDAANLYLQSKSVDANVANQQAQADKTNAETYAYLYKNLGEDAAKNFATAHNMSVDDNSYLSQSLKLGLQEQDENIRKMQLQNSITEKYGAKEAESRIANIEQLTTKYVGELGLMSARADLTRSEIRLNEKRAYELGARAAQEFASARLFGSEAKINEDTLQYVVGQAKLSYNSNKLSYFEQFAGFQSRSGIRSYMTSPEGISRQTWNYKQSPEGNYVSAFINGFTNSANLSFGGNYNYSRSFGTNRSYGNSWIYNAKDFYPVGK